MSLSIPVIEPARLTVGDSWTWRKYHASFLPADGWVLKYDLVNASAREALVSSDYGDGGHLIAVTPATTAGYTAGEYALIGYVDDGTDRHEVYRGSVRVLANSIAAVDLRSHVKIVLDALQATIQGKATNDQLATSIEGRSISRMTFDEIRAAESHYAARYQAELDRQAASNAGGNRNKVVVRL